MPPTITSPEGLLLAPPKTPSLPREVSWCSTVDDDDNDDRVRVPFSFFIVTAAAAGFILSLEELLLAPPKTPLPREASWCSTVDDDDNNVAARVAVAVVTAVVAAAALANTTREDFGGSGRTFLDPGGDKVTRRCFVRASGVDEFLFAVALRVCVVCGGAPRAEILLPARWTRCSLLLFAVVLLAPVLDSLLDASAVDESFVSNS